MGIFGFLSVVRVRLTCCPESITLAEHRTLNLSQCYNPRMANFDGVIKELQAERGRLDQAIAVLTSLNGGTPGKSMSGTVRPKRHISAAGITRIRAAAKARWARVRAQKKKK